MQARIIWKWMVVSEWIQCLASPRHARSTWLVISEEDEARAFRYIKVALVILGLLATLSVIRGYNHYQHIQYLKAHQPIQTIKVHLNPGERVI